MGGSKSPKVEKVDVLTPEQKKMLGAYTEIAGQYTRPAVEKFMGQDITQSPMYAQASRVAGQFLESGGYNPAQMREYYQNALVEPAMRQYQERILPAIQERFAGANAQRSSALNQALSSSAQGVQRDLQSQLAALLFQGEQAGLNRQQQAIAQALGISQMPFQQAQAQLAPILGMGQQALGTKAFDIAVTPGKQGPGAGIGTLLGAGVGAAFGGAAGAQLGASIGGAAGSLF